MKSNWRAAIIVLTVLVVLVGAAGWYLAIVRASSLDAARTMLRADDARAVALGHDQDALRQQVASLQTELASSRRAADQAQASLATAKGAEDSVATLKTQLAAANARADDAAAQLQALQQTRATQEPTKSLHQHAAAPAFDLPPSASAHDYLEASRQALQSGNPTRAKAALGRAAVRSLNEAQLGKLPTAEQQERSHRIDQAIRMLDAGKTSSALQLVTKLLAG